jgi:1-acyl-sn-glycerol-3-phosphate acyltransferase
VLNRTTVFGRDHVGDEPNTVLLSNHQSMIDSFPVAIEAYYPRAIIKPYLIPWNVAAWENFFKHPLLAFYSSHLRCIPVRPGRRDLKALHRMIEVLPTGTMTLFPEGTRSRTGHVLNGRPGAGLLILATRPRVIPVAIEGMQDILPIGAKTPRIGKRVMLSIGPALDYSEFLDRPRTRETAQELVDKAMAAIRAQHAELRRLREQARQHG